MKRVNSPRVKILYDIYHAQIMDGDIVRNIRDNIQWIGHFHTGGNPGRHEIDDTQELNYRFIMKAIADLGFTGFVTHEYSPTQGNDATQGACEGDGDLQRMKAFATFIALTLLSAGPQSAPAAGDGVPCSTARRPRAGEASSSSRCRTAGRSWTAR